MYRRCRVGLRICPGCRLVGSSSLYQQQQQAHCNHCITSPVLQAKLKHSQHSLSGQRSGHAVRPVLTGCVLLTASQPALRAASPAALQPCGQMPSAADAPRPPLEASPAGTAWWVGAQHDICCCYQLLLLNGCRPWHLNTVNSAAHVLPQHRALPYATRQHAPVLRLCCRHGDQLLCIWVTPTHSQ